MPKALAHNAFNKQSLKEGLYAHPSWKLMQKVLKKGEERQGQINGVGDANVHNGDKHNQVESLTALSQQEAKADPLVDYQDAQLRKRYFGSSKQILGKCKQEKRT